MFTYLCRGLAVGLLFGIPAGAVGVMTAQRTWMYGMRAGLLTGLGSSVADCLYASVGAFGLTVISDFLLRFQTVIYLGGGCLILLMGICLLTGKKEGDVPEETANGGGTKRTGEKAMMFFSSFTVGITNPAAILTFLFAFSLFDITGSMQLPDAISLVAGVFVGTYLWWGTLTGAVSWLKKKVKRLKMRTVNRVFGVLLSGFGIAVFVNGIL